MPEFYRQYGAFAPWYDVMTEEHFEAKFRDYTEYCDRRGSEIDLEGFVRDSIMQEKLREKLPDKYMRSNYGGTYAVVWMSWLMRNKQFRLCSTNRYSSCLRVPSHQCLSFDRPRLAWRGELCDDSLDFLDPGEADIAVCPHVYKWTTARPWVDKSNDPTVKRAAFNLRVWLRRQSGIQGWKAALQPWSRDVVRERIVLLPSGVHANFHTHTHTYTHTCTHICTHTCTHTRTHAHTHTHLHPPHMQHTTTLSLFFYLTACGCSLFCVVCRSHDHAHR
jgi:hypothetical protein